MTVVISLTIAFFSSLPSMAIIWLLNFFLKGRKIPLKTFAFISMLLAIVTVFYSELGLESGLFSLPFILIVLSCLWLFLLIFLFLGYNFVQRSENT